MLEPRIGLVIGDPAGVGPELSVKLLASGIMNNSNVRIFGSDSILRTAAQNCGIAIDIDADGSVSFRGDGARESILIRQAEAEITPGAASVAGGAYTLAGLRNAAQAVIEGRLDGVLYAPLNKQAMSLAGHKALDELHYFRDLLDVRGFCCELNNQGSLWTVRVTSHVPLREVANLITADTIGKAVRLGVEAVRRTGVASPRVVIAGLNPHLGEGGTMGREEIDIILPTAAALKADGIDIVGVYPADTAVPRALREGVDLVVTMYHDQGQIALKALGFDRTVTVLGGLPVPFATPSQGSAYDIAGKNLADPAGLKASFRLLEKMAANRLAEQPAL